MGRFEQDFQNYECYQDGDFYKKTVPDGLTDALADVYADACTGDDDQESVQSMTAVANDLLVIVGKKSTNNWHTGVLRTEIKSTFCLLSEEKFDRFMDGTRKAAESLYRGIPPNSRESFLRKVNSILNDKNFGYTLRQSAKDPDTLIWEGRWKATAGVSALESASEALESVFPKALEHIQQAKGHLLRPDEPRPRKDSVRDAMSAMEAMLKKLASENDIRDATVKLRAEGCWGLDLIVKEGISIWSHLHRLHPDIRHGQSTSSEIDLDEALYWLARITAYITYMANRAKAIGR